MGTSWYCQPGMETGDTEATGENCAVAGEYMDVGGVDSRYMMP